MCAEERRHFGRVRKMNFVRFLIRLGGWRLAIQGTASVRWGRGKARLWQRPSGHLLAPGPPQGRSLGSASLRLCDPGLHMCVQHTGSLFLWSRDPSLLSHRDSSAVGSQLGAPCLGYRLLVPFCHSTTCLSFIRLITGAMSYVFAIL